MDHFILTVKKRIRSTDTNKREKLGNVKIYLLLRGGTTKTTRRRRRRGGGEE